MSRSTESEEKFLTAAEPFAWTREDGSGAVSPDPDDLNSKRVVQCALSRVCGVCAEPLGRPIALLGTAAEVARNAFHAPPLHQACAEDLLARPDGAAAGWSLHLTAAFEFVRPGRDDTDRHPTFRLTSPLG